jgi:ABC-type uncharacterized transport system involved in gliding motility auxiliary subunit
LQVRIHNWLFVVLFLAVIGAIAWLSTKYSFEADWTAGNRNTLTEASQDLVSGLDGPLTLTAFTRDTGVTKRRIEDLVARYRQYQDDIALEFVNPDLDPARVRELGVELDGEIIVGYQGRTERVTEPSERALTTAIQRIARGGQRWVVFVEGHGERNPRGEANHDYGLFGAELERLGFKLQTVNPVAHGSIPDNTTLLVVAGPRVDLVPGAARLIADHVERGGNLLWLADPGPLRGLDPLAETLGVGFGDGVIVDTTGQVFGIDDPTMVIIADYGVHPVTDAFEVVTLFPHATAVDYDYEAVPADWRVDALLTTLPRSWLETGEIAGRIEMVEADGDRPGPLDVGITITAPHDENEQRIAVIGDGDFLANAYLNNGGNVDFGLNLFNWLVGDDDQIDIVLKSAPDLTLELPQHTYIALATLFLLVLPIGLVGAGVFIWWRRRRR